MVNSNPPRVTNRIVMLFGVLLVGAWNAAQAFPPILSDWQDRYGGVSASADNAGCQLCHESLRIDPAPPWLRTMPIPFDPRPQAAGKAQGSCSCESCGHGHFCHTQGDTCLDDSDCGKGTCNFDVLTHRWSCSVCGGLP